MHPFQRPALGHRLFAAFCAALVFALGVFAASPSLHRQLHHNAASSGDDTCAITLFANGVSAPVVLNAVPPPPADWHNVPFPRQPEIVLGPSRYRLPPERGPPAV